MKIALSGRDFDTETEGPELQAALDSIQAEIESNQKVIAEANAARGKADARHDWLMRQSSPELSESEIARLVSDEADFRQSVAPFLEPGFDFTGKSRADVCALAEQRKLDRSESYVPAVIDRVDALINDQEWAKRLASFHGRILH